jgi:membrane protease YdiL (CAAX protease family)
VGRRAVVDGDTARREGTGRDGPRWGWRLAAYGFLLVLLTLLLQAAVALAFPATLERLTLSGAAAACAAALVATWVMMSGVESRSPVALGLALSPRMAVDLARGVAIGLTLIGLVLGAMILGGWARVSPIGGTAPSNSGSVVHVTLLLLVAAFFEELAVRGYPFQLLARARGPGFAVGATSIVFALLHGANPGVDRTAIANTLLAGILLGILYWKTLSLWLVTGAHFSWNWVMGVGAGLPVSGLEVGSPLARIRVDGPEPWTGGAYGPEGGLLLSVVALLGIAWAARTSRLSRDRAVLAREPLMEIEGGSLDAT